MALSWGKVRPSIASLRMWCGWMWHSAGAKWNPSLLHCACGAGWVWRSAGAKWNPSLRQCVCGRRPTGERTQDYAARESAGAVLCLRTAVNRLAQSNYTVYTVQHTGPTEHTQILLLVTTLFNILFSVSFISDIHLDLIYGMPILSVNNK